MEKDSFERMLRDKVLQAEAALKQNSHKEGVWNSIQKKRQPRYKWYYFGAAILFIIGTGSVFYLKKDEAITVATKTDKHIVTSLPIQSNVEPARVKQEMVPTEKVETEQLAVIKPVESAVPTVNAFAQKEGLSIPVSPVADEIVAVIMKEVDAEIKVTPMTIVPEFTVQYKRGISIVENANENVIITTLKKFKLKRDTTYFANIVEKQSNKMKLTFKKEN